MSEDDIRTPQVEDSSAPAPVVPKRDGQYEIKFLLDHAVADEILNIVRTRMKPDPNSDPRLHDRYQINSLYFDNEHLDVFRRVPGFRKRKFRLRRYGESSTVFLERKAKSRGVVRKRRSLLPENELGQILHPVANQEWPGHWFHQRILRRHLGPKCHIAYERVARVDAASDGPIRLTVDRNVVCRPESGLHFPFLEQGLPLVENKSILELKFRTVLPPLFNNLVRDFALAPTSVSKYRLAIVACGLHVGVFDESTASTPAPLESGTDNSDANSRDGESLRSA